MEKQKQKHDYRGIIEITYNTGETLQHFYRSMKELKEWKGHGDLESYRIIRPLTKG